MGCSQHYIRSQSSSVPALATFNAVDANELVRYPNSVVTSHMTPNEGNLNSKIIYHGTDKVRVGNDSLLPIKHIGSLSVPTVTKPPVLKNVLHVSSLKIIYCPSDNFVKTTLAFLCLKILLFVSRAKPR